MITDETARKWISERKKFINDFYQFPEAGEHLSIEGKGEFTKTDFLIDINRNRHVLEKITFQNRFQKAVVLLRLDLDTKPHQNPDFKRISGNHLHIYREGYDDAFAYELDDPEIKKLNPAVDLMQLVNCEDQQQRFSLFSKFCSFTNTIHFEKDPMSLF